MRMGKAGREFVDKNYNWESSINQMIKIYHELLRE
jgi:glycosyltransferase involved in cell wall biosynthesis